MEQWKPVAGYEGLYEISDTGRVKSLENNKFRKEKILSPRKAGGGYLRVQLYREGKAKNMLVHRLVAEAFVPNPMGLETVNHRDEDKTNNSVSNLEWLTAADNNRYSKDRAIRQLDKLGNLVRRFQSMSEAERQTGIARSSICQVCRGRHKSAGGFSWKYA